MTACANCLRIKSETGWTEDHLERDYYMDKNHQRPDWDICPECRKRRRDCYE